MAAKSSLRGCSDSPPPFHSTRHGTGKVAGIGIKP